jgi:hypothetical protein
MTQEFANICVDLRELRRMIASEHRNDGGARAIEYLDEAKILIEVAYDVLRREARWAKKEAPRDRDLGTVH